MSRWQQVRVGPRRRASRPFSAKDTRISRMRISHFVLVATLSIPAAAQRAPSSVSARIWISNVSIVSPERLDRIEKGSVLIENGRIGRVVRGTHTKAPAGATVVYGEGRYLIPGLIDSHVHLESVP